MPQVTFSHLEALMGPQAADQQLHGYQIAQEYLRKRGIDTPQLVDALGLRFMFADKLRQATSNAPYQIQDDRLAIVFPHQSPDWWSARMVTTTPVAPATGFGALVAPRKQSKMHCPSGVPPLAYHPPLLDWDNIPVGSSIYIHESAIKAINGAKLGYYSVGLNGVWGWSNKYTKTLVDGLVDLPWRTCKLKPVIVFDSNVNTNPDVANARQRLAERLHLMFGTDVTALDVPPTPTGEDQGFDDWCNGRTEQEIRDWLNQPPIPVDIVGYQAELAKMNACVAFVRSISKVVEIDTGTQMTRDAFTGSNYATVKFENAEGELKPFAKAWMEDPRRTEVERLVYSPELPKGLNCGHKDAKGDPAPRLDTLNLWTGMGIEPVAGDVRPWLDLLEHGVPDPTLRSWIVQWFAYPLQNLGCKLDTYLLFYGPQGVGKNALIAPFHDIYGVNATIVAKEHFTTTFNDTYSARQFINIDELSGGGGPDALVIANKIKMLTTSPTLWVNSKGKAEYPVDNHANLVITSNHSDCIKLEEGDRRATVVQFGTREHIQPAPYWDAYFAWTKSGGPAALYDYLLRVDLTAFDPHGRAPFTEWKEQVTDATRGPMQKFARDLWDDASGTLPLLMRQARVLTPEQLAIAYKPDDRGATPNLKNVLGKAMSNEGFKAVKIKIRGAQIRLWIIDRTIDPADNETLRQAYESITSTTQSKF